MKERIREIAGELIKVAAMRATRAGVIAEADSSYPEFVNRFPYEETDDQDRAIDDVLEDLEAGKPMDRLVCGDVGFGKTEVALRAAFVMAMSGKQVALICPTTLLARQHYANFVERFHGFPINIGRLSRLVPAAEAKRTKEGLAEGKVDIVIGTHAMLAKSIEFKRLGTRHCRRGAAFRSRSQGAAEGAQERRPRPHPHRNANSAHAPDGDERPSRTVGNPDPAGRPPCSAHLRHAVRRRRASRGAASRAFPWRAELLRRAARRRPARHRGMASRAGTGGEVHHRARADERDRGRGADERLLRPQIRCTALDDDRRKRARYPEREHPHRLSLGPVRAGPALPAPRPRRPLEVARLCLSDDAGGPLDHRSSAEAAAGAERTRQSRRGIPAREPRSRHPRRRQPARRRAVGPHQGSRVRAVPVDARGRDRRAEGWRRAARRRNSRRRSASMRRS